MLAFLAVTCVLAPFGYVSTFSVFNAYDDEGYFLITLRDYLSGHALFTQVHTIYGPFYYETVGGLFGMLGLEPTNDSGRLLTFAVWLVASLVGGLVTYRLTRNAWLGISAQFVTFHVLTGLASEPIHPAGLISLLLLCIAGAAAFVPSRPRATAALIGATVAALVLVKVNVGGFAAFAVIFAFAASHKGRWRSFLLALGVALMAALPFGLMTPLLSQAWVLEFAVVVAMAGSAVGVACITPPPRSMAAPSAAWLLVGGAVVVVTCLGVAIAGGTRLADLVNGLVFDAWRLPQLYVWPVRINPIDVVWAALSLAVAIAATVLRANVATPAAAAGAVRVIAGFLTWMLLLLLPSSLFLLALPLAWLATQPPREMPNGAVSGYARLLLPALAVLESLQAYPVAGTQQSVAALALVPVGAISLGDGIWQLSQGMGDTSLHLDRLAKWAAPAALLFSIAAFQFFGFLALIDFTNGAPLGLPGAKLVRLPAQRGADLRALVAAIDGECSSFITLPGMTSFYLWAAQDEPAQLNGVWMFGLDSSAQQSIVQQVKNRPRLCVVKSQTVIDFWSEGRQVPNRPLVEYIRTGFVRVGSYGDYELLVRVDQQLGAS